MRASIAAIAGILIVSSLVGSPLPSNKNFTNAPFKATGRGPHFFIDYSNFKGVDNQTYTEFYIQVGYHELQFIKNKKLFQSGYDLELSIMDENNSVVESFKNSDSFEVGTFAETESFQKARLSMVAFTFEPGTYTIKAVMTDHETEKSSKIKSKLIVDNFKPETLLISDIQLSQKIELCEEEKAFVKNSRYIEPNAVGTFATGLADIYLYFEIYNLTHQPNKLNYNYTAYFSIKNRKSQKSKEFQQVNRIPGLTAAHSLRLNVDQFSGGDYELRIRILDEATGQTAETTKNFTVLDSPVALLDFEKGFQR